MLKQICINALLCYRHICRILLTESEKNQEYSKELCSATADAACQPKKELQEN